MDALIPKENKLQFSDRATLAVEPRERPLVSCANHVKKKAEKKGRERERKIL